MTNQQYRVSGAIFENDRPTGPAFSGVIEIDGVKTNVALWPKTSKGGKNYFQVSEDKKAKLPQGGGTGGRSPFKPRAPAPQANDMDDDIPF